MQRAGCPRHAAARRRRDARRRGSPRGRGRCGSTSACDQPRQPACAQSSKSRADPRTQRCPLIARGTAEHPPARRMHRAVVHAGAGFGGKIPVEARIAEGLEEPGRDLEVGVPRLPARFQQQHAPPRIGGEAVGQHAAGAARADDDVVPVALEALGVHAAAASVGAVPATQVRTMWRRSVVVAKGVARCSTARLSHITRSCGRQRCA